MLSQHVWTLLKLCVVVAQPYICFALPVDLDVAGKLKYSNTRMHPLLQSNVSQAPLTQEQQVTLQQQQHVSCHQVSCASAQGRGTHLPLEMTTLLYCTRRYSSSRLNLPVTTPMDPVMVRGSATILLAPIAM